MPKNTRFAYFSLQKRQKDSDKISLAKKIKQEDKNGMERASFKKYYRGLVININLIGDF